ncbi:hypothetical protein GCM10020221_27190 [Streptomyces thioluteus]|uniref:2-oxo-4-hydroxy-4-carboxy-5-ureidoimidazoline decarboxylase n=1 Tax=Streptomyces thioluteus TaxID=66431 RepID=A0ABN3WYB9_STRTU
MTASSAPGLARFNAMEGGAARGALLEICASTAWAGALLAHRPYPDVRTLLGASDAAVAALDAADLAEAMSAHPPIGRPAAGDDRSAREQRGMADAPDDLRAEMLGLNLAYQEKFGHVFLVCAAGLTAAELRDAVRRRITNPPGKEGGDRPRGAGEDQPAAAGRPRRGGRRHRLHPCPGHRRRPARRRSPRRARRPYRLRPLAGGRQRGHGRRRTLRPAAAAPGGRHPRTAAVRDRAPPDP